MENVVVEILASSKHMGEVEITIRTVKERGRIIVNTLP